MAAAFGACVAAAVATAPGGFTCALPPTWWGLGSDGEWVGATDANERTLHVAVSPC
ncbi:hypothetical protein PR003_g11175 [Phytophthora rubi]|uniref:Uncharacterized protein n=1 Tax=Phytophthora rubi TaxID=129364 RepID=A0A6A3ML02_9STRA|nr:hypothetical protein PR002_g9730 [Phytophthora rubi]KAE9032218.1 hypothetical protein PR001_g10715 [Phytophthora rubi]KAE9339121.1 hypothetical protein PR003_g11175 [Phytophthora rubi]